MKITYRIENLCCANCAAKMEASIKKLPGVIDAKIAFMTAKLYLDLDEAHRDALLAEVKKIMKKIEPDCEIKEL